MATPKHNYRTNIPPEVLDLFRRANAGEEAALWELQTRFDADPALVAWAGDLVGLAQLMITELVAGRNALGVNDAILHQTEALESKLAAECETELERLLARRVAVASLWLSLADLQLVKAQRVGGATRMAGIREATYRMDRAQARLLAASKALAQVRQLCRSPRSPLRLYQEATPKAGAGGFRRKPAGAPEEVPAGAN